jgi:hypothetical protein
MPPYKAPSLGTPSSKKPPPPSQPSTIHQPPQNQPQQRAQQKAVPFKAPPVQQQRQQNQQDYRTQYQAVTVKAPPPYPTPQPQQQQTDDFNPFDEMCGIRRPVPTQSSNQSDTTTAIPAEAPTPTMADVRMISIPSRMDPPPQPPRASRPQPAPPQQTEFWSTQQGQKKIQKALIKILRYDIQYQNIEARYMRPDDHSRTFFETPALKPMDLLARIQGTFRGQPPQLQHLRQVVETARNINDRRQFAIQPASPESDTRTADDVIISITDHEAGPGHFQKTVYQMWDLTHWKHVTQHDVPAHRAAYTYYYPEELRNFVIKYCQQAADIEALAIPPQINPPTIYENLYRAQIEEYNPYVHKSTN